MKCEVRVHPLTAVTILAMLLSKNTLAAEGGASGYLQGTYNDFAVAMASPPGYYLRNDLFYYDATVGARPLGGQIDLGATQQVWGNLLKFAYVSDIEILGGTYGAAIVLPIVLDASATGSLGIGAASVEREGDTSGIGDVFLQPFQIYWTQGNQHFAFTPGIVVPTGGYDQDRLLNTGRNYWSFDLAGSYTWLHPQRGHEISFTPGVLFNGRNSDTDYRTGNEFHLDWTVAQHFSESFAIGLTGYWYEQITGDSGPLPAGFDASDFKSSGVGVGVAALYSTKIGSRDVYFIGKWIDDVSATKRFEGEILMLSVAMKLN